MSGDERVWGTPPSAIRRGADVLRRGSRVRLAPRARGDAFDRALAGKIGRVEGIDQDDAGQLMCAVVLEDDPGRDLGRGRFPGHRFFFALDEIEPLAAPEQEERRLLVAGIGNVFLGDDGFGVAVVRALAERALPPEVELVDFGIRGLDLAYALQDGVDGAILVDALPLDAEPGTLAVLRPEVASARDGRLDSHGMDPARVLALARRLGTVPAEVLVVGCAPRDIPALAQDDELCMRLSPPVAAAVAPAVERILSLVAGFLAGGGFALESRSVAAGEGSGAWASG